MYDQLRNHKDTIAKLTTLGVIDPHWLRDIEIMEMYNNLKTNCQMCKYTIIAAKFGISEDRVRNRIREMRG